MSTPPEPPHSFFTRTSKNTLHTSAPEQRTEKLRVWSPFIRVWHWSFATCVIMAYLTSGGHTLFLVHVSFGILAFALAITRIMTGFFGPKEERFSTYYYSPQETLAYFKGLLSGQNKRYVGHNPAGTLMIFTLITLVFLIPITGLIRILDYPLGLELHLRLIHQGLGNLIIILVCLHIGGVILENFLHKDSLVRSMITGYKKATKEEVAEYKKKHH